jgi:DNA-binding NarL/FixJ family response regulator
MLMDDPVRSAAPARRSLPNVLLLEPDYVLRRALALTAASEQLVHVHETGSHERMAALVARHRFDGFLIAVNEAHDGLHWIEAIRSGHTRSDTDTPIVVLADRIDRALAQQLRSHRVRSILLKPCKVRPLMDALTRLQHKHP